MLLYNIFHMLIQVFNPSPDVDCSLFAPQLKYKEHYNKNVKGQWCETPYFEVANARVAMENLSDVRSDSFIKSSIFLFIPVFPCSWQSPLFLYRDDTRSTTKTRKTKFISCRQTRPSMTHTRSLVLLPVRWAHKAHTHAHTCTNRYWGIFIGPISCGRHDKEVTRVSEQRVRVNTPLWRRDRSVSHRMAERFGPIQLHKLICVPSLYPSNSIPVCEETFQLAV